MRDPDDSTIGSRPSSTNAHAPAYSIFGDYANEPALELAGRLAALAPMPNAKVFVGSATAT